MAQKTCYDRLKPNDLFLTLLLESCLESSEMVPKSYIDNSLKPNDLFLTLLLESCLESPTKAPKTCIKTNFSTQLPKAN